MMQHYHHHSSFERQRGLASLEFAISGLATLIILFGAIEMGRMMFTMNTLAEATRRGARVASVCLIDDPQIARIAVFNSSGSGTDSPILKDLTTNNIAVEYLNADGGVLVGAAGDDSIYTQIRYVRVRITDYQYRFIIPGVDIVFTAPQFPTTVPRESLGVPKPDQTSTCA